ncbi:MAG: hypothetical protein V9E98_10850 [Candidatus Nanopelagicales bacterium]
MFTPARRRSLSPAILAMAVIIAGLLVAAPARAGQDITIELNNQLPKTQPLYPRLALRSLDNFCWYPQDFDRDDLSAPAGGGYVSVSSEVRNAFFSFCSPTWNPLKDSLVRWQQFRLMAQSAPGAQWEPVTWGDNHFTFLMSYWKIVMDVRGYHFDLNGLDPRTPVQTPVGQACLTLEPRMFNYTNLFRMTVSKAQDGECSSSAASQAGAIQERAIQVGVNRTKKVVVGPVRGRAKGTQWTVRRSQCTSDHFRVEGVRVHDGPGGSRWEAVTVRGTNPGRDQCVLDLTGPRQQRLMSQRVTLTVR